MKKMRMPKVRPLYDRWYDRRHQPEPFDDWLLLERDYDDRGPHWQVYHTGALVYDGSMEECIHFVGLNREPEHAEPSYRPLNPNLPTLRPVPPVVEP